MRMLPIITGLRRQVLIALCLYTGQLALGFSAGWPGPVLIKLRNHEQSPLDVMLSEPQLSLVASISYVGSLPGPYIMGWLANAKGRKPCIIMSGLITVVGYIILAIARNISMLFCGRLIIGVGIGNIALMNILYIGELASTNVRGIFLTIIGVFTTCGFIILYPSAYYLSYTGLNYVGLVLSAAYSLFCLWIPESPIFHILKGNDDAVIKTLEGIGRSEDIEKLLAAKQEFRETSAKRNWIELFKLKSNRRALLIAVVVNIFQHSCGAVAVTTFAGIIFEKAGSTMDSNISMLILTVFQLIGSLISPFLVEKLGRKILLATSSAICSITMILFGFYFYLDHLKNPVIDSMKWFPLVILITFFIGYDFGLGIIPNTLAGEMFTTNVRSNGSAVVVTISWLAGFLVLTAFGSLLEIIGGHVAFWIFGGVCFSSVLFAIFCIVETKGKSLLEVQEILSK